MKLISLLNTIVLLAVPAFANAQILNQVNCVSVAQKYVPTALSIGAGLLVLPAFYISIKYPYKYWTEVESKCRNLKAHVHYVKYLNKSGIAELDRIRSQLTKRSLYSVRSCETINDFVLKPGDTKMISKSMVYFHNSAPLWKYGRIQTCISRVVSGTNTARTQNSQCSKALKKFCTRKKTLWKKYFGQK